MFVHNAKELVLLNNLAFVFRKGGCSQDPDRIAVIYKDINDYKLLVKR
jgi:hypothetical protein